MKIISDYNAGTLTFYLKGELDHHEAGAAMRSMTRVVEDYMPGECVVDMGELTFMDSSGIALILKISRLMGETGGTARVEHAGRQPLKVIDASGIDRLIQITTAAEPA